MPFCGDIMLPAFVLHCPYAQPTAAITAPVPCCTATSLTVLANAHCASLVSSAQPRRPVDGGVGRLTFVYDTPSSVERKRPLLVAT